ncbi:DUF4468 domain-containing protein [Chitinophaga ginsengisegetis]|uniref:DUF4468 domain-containing protein n=1 Tax=Chitinophaga ginsengisegetis TaxID=393003 RepID=UPI000DB99F75|nr:DUF4468 domain-containing protein [Chitinophaga ginsengisegetis]MDR6565447.1 hypothetical protein [Chitinophaga ginsengisegetis]MDR6645175.1 hypothetical protein [Chitinophaga ginsengisegetis]MDR6652233.1 hypothetical protein [Chitinophaga ginsengisegetis]
MKYLLSTLLTIAPLLLKAQEVPFPINENGSIEYTEVVQVDSVSEQQLYSRARLFVANAFKSATDVTQLEDAATFTLVTKGNLPRFYSNPFNKTQGGYVSFKFTVQCRPGRYKYSVTDLIHKQSAVSTIHDSGGVLTNEVPDCGRLNLPLKSWKRIKVQTDHDIHLFIDELKQTMAGKADFSGNDNW